MHVKLNKLSIFYQTWLDIWKAYIKEKKQEPLQRALSSFLVLNLSFHLKLNYTMAINACFSATCENIFFTKPYLN